MIGILGSGSWATAVVKILMEQSDQRICWYVREPEIRESLAKYGRNYRYLAEVELDKGRLEIRDNAQSVAEDCQRIYLVVPTAYLHGVMQSIDPGLLRQRQLVSAIKGFVPETGEIVSDYLQHTYQVPARQLAIVSGPTHAEEVARERLTFITAASPNAGLAEEVRQQLRCQYINATASDNMEAIQYATALKNIYALAAGVCKGMGGGDNLLAVLVSYCVAETYLFIRNILPNWSVQLEANTLPPYLGDLLVTCYSQFSRNRTFGTMIGRGYSVRSTQLEMNMVAEGYYAVKSLEKIRQRLGLEMPIAQATYRVLYENAKPDVLLRAWQIYRGNEG